MSDDRTTWDEPTLLAALTREMTACTVPLDITFTPVPVFQLAAVVQLALRHPGVPDHLRATARTFVDGVAAYFAEAGCPAVVEALRRGD